MGRVGQVGKAGQVGQGGKWRKWGPQSESQAGKMLGHPAKVLRHTAGHPRRTDEEEALATCAGSLVAALVLDSADGEWSKWGQWGMSGKWGQGGKWGKLGQVRQEASRAGGAGGKLDTSITIPHSRDTLYKHVYTVLLYIYFCAHTFLFIMYVHCVYVHASIHTYRYTHKWLLAVTGSGTAALAAASTADARKSPPVVSYILLIMQDRNRASRNGYNTTKSLSVRSELFLVWSKVVIICRGVWFEAKNVEEFWYSCCAV